MPGVLSASAGSVLTDEDIQTCIDAVDNSFYAYTHDDITDARFELERVESQCTGYPQFHHNLGVLEFNSQRWEEAAQQFQLAIASDRRAAESVAALRSIHRYQAALSYQNSLGTGSAAKPPQLAMQSTSLKNSDILWQRKSNTYLRSVTTIDYELYDWWLAIKAGQIEAHSEHYVDNYPASHTNILTSVSWEDIDRDIAFTQSDAVVVLSFPHRDSTEHLQLLLRLQGERWKIYRETHW